MKIRILLMSALGLGLVALALREIPGKPVGGGTGRASSVERMPALLVSGEAQPAGVAGKAPPKADRDPDFRPLHEFRGWLSAYLAAEPAERPGMVADGARMAAARRPEMKRLIAQHPQLALELAVRPVVRQQLPESVTEHLEKPVSRRGDFKAYFGRPLPGAVVDSETDLVLRYLETTDGESYRAHVFGAMQEAVSRQDVPFFGYAIDRELAVAESPVRALDAGETVAAGTVIDETCPVSGTVTPTQTAEPIVVEPEVPLAELAGRVIRLCNGTHVTVFEEAQRWASGGPGGAGYFYDNYPGTSSEAIGNFRCLYIRITYPDQMRAPNTEARAWSDMQNVSRFYLESSYGKLTTTSVVTPLIVLPHTKAWYIAKDSEVDGLGLVHSHARAEARKLGYDNSQFNCTIVRVNEGPRLSGISWGGGDSVWVSWDGMDVLNHECGHSLGRNHANFWRTSDGTAIGVGENQEYGNSYDVMGGGGGFGAHYNSYSKRSLGWLQDPFVHRPGTTASHNGIYRLYAYDQPRLEEGRRYSLRVDKDAQRRFYLEYHPAIGGAWPQQALLMMSGLGSNAGHLVDTTPGSPGGKGDGGIQIGRTFSDFESDLHFTVLGKGGTSPESLDVAMLRGPFSGNRPPTVSLTATTAQVAVNGTVTFTATASDPDGDPLAYHWDCTDGAAGSNSATFTRQFTSTDQQTIHVTVSDLKGGTARAHTVLTIGSPGRAVARGTISTGGRPLAGALVTSDTDKYCYTDSSGNYALADLQSGTRTLTATMAGYTFTAGFTNPVSLPSAGLGNLNWTATSVPEITLTATDATEGGPAGTFVITRTGPLSDPLPVIVNPAGGTAVKTSDYTFAPDYTASGSMNAFTIPAGAASLTVNVAAVNDTAQEGPETVTLQLGPGTGYQVRTSGLASLTIADNDTSRPVVSIAASDLYAAEGGNDSAAFTVSRTGATTAALTVSLNFSGTAANGTDFSTVPAALTIPAGQAATTIAINPVNDTLPEPPEDATLTVATNAAYVVSTTESSASVTISDDDLAVLSLSTADDTLHENGRGTGLVIISRTGSLAAPLRVFYGLGGRALHGTDYVALPGEITFPAGVSAVPVVITPYDDDHGEADESITFTLTTFENAYSLGGNYSTTLTIRDNADAPVVGVTANSAAEPSTAGTFTFTAVGSVPGNLTVRYSLSGTATGGQDFTIPSGTVTIAGTSTDSKGSTATVSIPVTNDSLPEHTETIVLTITPDPSYRVYLDGQAVMRLKDDDAEPVAVSIHSSKLAEPTDDSSFYLSRAGTTGNLTVAYTMAGTATNGTDYQSLPGTAVIPDGASGVDITVTPIEDSLREGTETVTLRLTPGNGYGFETSEATLLLEDNDLASSLPSMGFASATGSTTEAPDPVNGAFRDIEVTMPSAMPNPVSVDYIMRGGTATGDDVDWSFVDASNGNSLIRSGTLRFNPGSTSQKLRIRIHNDGVVEGSETIVIDLVNLNTGGSGVRLSGTRYRHTLTVTDHASANPVPRVSFLMAATTRQESDGGEPLLTAVLDAPSAGTVTVRYAVGGTATPGSDFTLAPGTLTFAPGEMFRKLPLVLIADGLPELAETIVVTLSNPTAATLGSISTHTITVTDASAPVVTVTASPATVEEDSSSSGSFTVTRSGGLLSAPLPVSFSLGGTAASGTDFIPLPSSVVIPAGQTQISLPVSPVADLMEEGDETVVFTITDAPDYDLGSPSEATVTILDDDAPPVVTLVSPAAAEVAIPTGVGLLAEADATRELPSGTVHPPVTWTSVSGPAPAVIETAVGRRTAIRFPVPGIYVLRASATHGTTAGTDLTVNVAAPAVPLNFTASRFGNAPATTGFSFNAATRTFQITAGGMAIPSTGTADQFLFAQQPVTGDCTITARIVSIGTGGSDTSDNRAGVMIREGITDGGSRHAFVGITKSPAIRFITRTTPAAASTNLTGTGTFPRWLRLTRRGDAFTAETAPDSNGTAGPWTTTGTVTIPMNANAFIGLAAASGSSSGNTLAAVVADRVSILPHGPISNLAPAVDAGPALAGKGPWSLDGTISDDGLPLPAILTSQWLTVSGPHEAVFSNASSSDTSVTFPGAGAYTLRLTASDGEVTTFDDTEATVVPASPSEAWRSQYFGADAANPAIAGDSADPDHDGSPNLVEYALATHPLEASPPPLRDPETDGDSLTVTYQINTDATDANSQLQWSDDLATWSAAPASNAIISETQNVRTIRASLPAAATRRFLRLRVSR